MSKKSITINVLRAFRFTTPANRAEGIPMPVERVFTVGVHEIDLATAKHPWIAAPNYADGSIETPEQAAKRLAERKAKLQTEAMVSEHAKKHSDAAIARMQQNLPKRADAVQATQEELNTPVGVLRARQQAASAEAQ